MTIAEWLTKHDRYKRKVDARLRAERNAVIEECARMIEARVSDAWCKWSPDIAVTIRALKEQT